MKFHILFAFASSIAIGLLSTPCFADEASRQADHEAVENLEYEFAKAMIKPDLEWMDEMLAEDFKIVLPNGQIKDKKAFVDSWRANAWDYHEIDVLKPDIRIYGDSAVSIGRAHNKGVKNNGEEFSHDELWTDVLVKRNGKWRYVSIQVMMLKTE